MRSVGLLIARQLRCRAAASTVTSAAPTSWRAVPASDAAMSAATEALTPMAGEFRKVLHTGAAALSVADVSVPSMGDSITEGTIVNIGKAAGDSVAEDEVIAQIETDKVTIDVRAPHAGTVTRILVSDEQSVEVGQVVAQLDSEGGSAEAQAAGSQPSQGSGKAEATVEPAPRVGGRPMAAERPQPSGSQDGQAPSGGRACLHFPPRRLEDGTRISDLPPAEAAEHTARLSGSKGDGPQHQQHPGPPGGAPATTSEEAESERQGVMLRRWAVGAPLPSDEDWQPAPGKWALSDREMEMIDLGGADP